MAAKYTILIADDEEIECKALSLLLQKEFPEISLVGIASNGMELVSMAKRYQPDIAIVDVNMPGINGIDAIDLLRTKNSKTHFIINTAYNDFEYVQRALSLKIDAYILKPEKRDTTIQTIRKLCQQIDVNRQTRDSQQQIHALFTQVQSVMENEIMYSLFIGEPAGENFETYCDMHGISFQSGTVVALIPVIGGNRFHSQDKARLRSMLDETLGNSCTYLASVTEANICLLLFVEKGTAHDQQRWIHDVLRVMLDKLNRRLSLSLRAGVGGIYPAFGQMANAYQESLLALMAPSEEGISFFRSQSVLQRENAELLLCQLREGNLQRLSSEFGRIRQQLEGDPESVTVLWQEIQECLGAEAAQMLEVRKQLEQTAAALQKGIPQESAVDLILESLLHLTVLLKEPEKDAEKSYVGQALHYIEEHYAEDISLDLVAEKIGISPFYLSRLFRTERGESFVEYLTATRMQVAVRLAKETRLSIREIAVRTGYGSPTYFCRVFKKHVGCTIGDLREQARKKRF